MFTKSNRNAADQAVMCYKIPKISLLSRAASNQCHFGNKYLWTKFSSVTIKRKFFSVTYLLFFSAYMVDLLGFFFCRYFDSQPIKIVHIEIEKKKLC